MPSRTLRAHRVERGGGLRRRLHVGAATWQMLRVPQWVKNLLVFVPLAAAHRLHQPTGLAAAMLAFVSFNLAASSGYVLNDLTDLEEDRRRPQTAQRPLVAGDVSRRAAVVLLLAALGGAFTIALLLPAAFRLTLLAYWLLMCAYSLHLKRYIALDVLALAGGYSLRVVAGAAACSLQLSGWLIAVCSALFMSLALLKRYAELVAIGPTSGGRLRGYLSGDASILAMQGIASGHIGVAVLILYAVTATTRNPHPVRAGPLYGLAILLLYWTNYLWVKARRGEVPHDPVGFALKDPVSRTLLLGMALLALAAVW